MILMTFWRNKVLDKQPWVFYNVHSTYNRSNIGKLQMLAMIKRAEKAGLSIIPDSEQNK